MKLFSIAPILGVVAAPEFKDMDLSGLKDVILSEKPSLFPLPVGWICLLILFFVLACCVLWYIKYRFFPSPYAYAIRELDSLKTKNLTLVETGAEISKLLKRVAILKFGREQVAELSDKEWGDFLMKKGKDIFSKKEINFIQKAAWMPPEKEIAISKDSLYNHTKEWIKFILKGK